jgi:hydrogenase maturation protease
VTNRRILVAGVGNVFLGDDGFGVEVVRRLANRPLPPEVRVADFGIRGLDLAYALLEPYDLVIVVDANRREGPPGTLYVLEGDPTGSGSSAVDAHGMIPTRALGLAHEMGARIPRLIVVGCEPESFGEPGVGRMELSGTVAGVVEEAVRLVDSLLQRQGGAAVAQA